MFYELNLHDFIERNNVLKRPAEQLNEFFRNHPDLHKAALLADHIFRAVAMAALNMALPFSAPVNIAICFAGSLFYRLTAETHCAYKFALPAFAGSIAIPLGLPALASLVSGAAFASLSVFSVAVVTLIPLAAYITYIVLTVDHDVNHR